VPRFAAQKFGGAARKLHREAISMTTSTCRNCGTVIFKPGPGRPRKLCPDCRTERYGLDHKARRAAELADYVGRPCSRCGKPMLEDDEVHLDHVDGGGPNDYRGLSHAKCNMAGAARSRAVAAGRPRLAAGKEQPVAKAGRYDPGPPREGIVHEPPGRCHCEERAWTMGVWPSRCF
jgi:hypothetical protein